MLKLELKVDATARRTLNPEISLAGAPAGSEQKPGEKPHPRPAA
jgi:hypothetical protein